MKNLCMAIVMLGLLAVAAPAQAGDWDGVYYGVHTGASNGTGTANTTTVFSPTGYFAMTSVPAIATAGSQTIKTPGINLGLTLGVSGQHGTFVYGVEADYGSVNMSSGASTTAQYPCCAPTSFTVSQKFNSNTLLTVRPRLGIDVGKTLLYATGGFAMTTVNYQAQFTDTFATALETGNISKSVSGFTYGGGVETRLDPHWSLKGEYLYTNFGTLTTTSTNLMAFTPPIAFPTNVFTHSINLNANVIRLGINYR